MVRSSQRRKRCSPEALPAATRGLPGTLRRSDVCAKIRPMSDAPPSGSSSDAAAPMRLDDRFERLGRSLGEREREFAGQMERARAFLESLRAAVAAALADFQAGAKAAGAPPLAVELSPVRTDDKHVRAVEFELVRGRHRAIVTAKSRGEVTLVGPFHQGKNEGPCRSLPFEAGPEIRGAVGDFLEKFLEAAATP